MINRDGWAMLGVTFWRDLRIALSYRLAFALQFLSTLFQVVVFYFIGRLITGPAPGLAQYGGDYFAYALIGLAFLPLFNISLSGFASAITEAQQTGVLEAQALLPTPLPLLILGANIWPFLYALGTTVVYLLLGILLGVPLAGANLMGALVIALLGSLAISGLGLMGAAMILVFKRGNAVAWGVAAAAGLLSGVYFPPQLLPAPLQLAAYALPHTFALAGLRAALLNQAGWQELLPDMLALLGFSAVLLPAGILSLLWALKQAQIKGNLAQY